MSLILPDEQQNNFELISDGTFVATCYRVIDLGTQKNEYQGKINFHHQIIIGWELTDEKMKDGQPFAVQKFYNVSSNEKASLRIDLESWRSQPFTKEEFGKFNIANLIGKSCLMGIVHENKNGKVKPIISSILRLPKSMIASNLINPTVLFDLSDFKQDVYDSLSDFCKGKISISPEYIELKNPSGEKHELNDSMSDVYPEENIPF